MVVTRYDKSISVLLIGFQLLFAAVLILAPTRTAFAYYKTNLGNGVTYYNLFYCPASGNSVGQLRPNKEARNCSTTHVIFANLEKVQLEPVISNRWSRVRNKGYYVYAKKTVGEIADASAGKRRAVAVVNGGFFEIKADPSANYSRFEGRGDSRNNSPHSGWWQTATKKMKFDSSRKVYKGATGKIDLEDRVFYRTELRIFEDSAGKQNVQLARPFYRDTITSPIRMLIGGAGALLPVIDAQKHPRYWLDPSPNIAKARTAVGYVRHRPNRLCIVTVKNDPGVKTVQLSYLMSLMLDRLNKPQPPAADKDKRAFSLDGGGSSQMWIKPTGSDAWQKKMVGRKVVNALAIYTVSKGQWYLVPDPASPDPGNPRLIITEVEEGKYAPGGSMGPFATEDEAYGEQQEIYRRRGW